MQLLYFLQHIYCLGVGTGLQRELCQLQPEVQGWIIVVIEPLSGRFSNVDQSPVVGSLEEEQARVYLETIYVS